MDSTQRLKYYLGDFYGKTKINLKVDDKYKIFHQNGIYYYLGPNAYPQDFRFEHGFVRPAWWWGYNNGFYIDFPCLTVSADGYNSDELPVLAKARIIGKPMNGILVKYEYDYHWSILNNFKDNYNWNEKENNIVWRGNSVTSYNKKYNRYDFISKYYKEHNVGFTGNNPNISSDLFKDILQIDEQLKYKYLICLEGNDVATSLKWSLMSNSVVIMSKPIIEGWLMEGLLQPYVHYVPLNDDFSDLNEIIEWCRNNDDACKQISENATKWMMQFLDSDNEMKLHNAIREWYQSNINLF